MTNPNTSFIITLTKTPSGYLFHSIATPSTNSKKTQPLPKAKSSKIPNRLFKEIGILQESQDDPPAPTAPASLPHDPQRPEPVTQPEEPDPECEIKRINPLPKCAAKWFSRESISEYQKKKLPEFFENEQDGELYKRYRNFMIEAYTANSNRYLTFIACRRVLRGNVGTLMRVFNFLEQEGLINYCVSFEGNYTFKTSFVQKTYDFVQKPQSIIKTVPSQNQTEPPIVVDTDALTLVSINKHFSRTFRIFCTSCKLITGVVWYASLQDQASYSLCPSCFNALEKQASVNFIKMDIVKKADSSREVKQHRSSKAMWSIEDNIKLLQFMSSERVDKSWKELLDQLDSKKGLEDIIIQLMQFPIVNFEVNGKSQQIGGGIQYPSKDYVDLLQKYYLESVYFKQGKKGERRQPSVRSSSFEQIAGIILSKYSLKLEHLKEIEGIIDQSNLKINQQSWMKDDPCPLAQ